MISLLTNLTKAVVAVAATPIVVIVDILTLISNVNDPYNGPFHRTKYMFDAAGEAMKEAVSTKK